MIKSIIIIKSLFLILTCEILLLHGCNTREENPFKFKKGEHVLVKLDSRVGVVILGPGDTFWCNNYLIRFSNKNLITNTHIIGADDPIESSPYSTVWMNDYELKKVK